MLLNSIRGTDGRVTIPSIGALIGYFSGWSLVKQSPMAADYTFTGTFGYLNEALWRKTIEGEYSQTIVIKVGKEKHYRLEPADGAGFTLNDNQLVMEHVSLVET